jgi:hypothetical protein
VRTELGRLRGWGMRNWRIRGLGKRTGEGKRLAYEDWGGFVDRGHED